MIATPTPTGRHDGTLVLIAKMPVPGRVKTRLCPPCTPEQAAQLADAALSDTIEAMAATPRSPRLLAALEGTPDARFEGWEVVAQRGNGLDERLEAAFADAGPGPTVLVGMDTPQLTAAQCRDALDALDEADAVFGPARDGGFWLLGLRTPVPGAIAGVPMSSAETGARQLERLRARGLRTVIAATMRDVDLACDAAAVAATAPESRFAATWREL